MTIKKDKDCFKWKIKGIFIITLFLSICIIGQRVYALDNRSYNQQKNVRKILILNSYDREYSWISEMVDGIVEELKTSGVNSDVSMEYIKLKDYPEEYSMKNIKDKYKDVQAVVATDSDTLEFLLKNRQNIFNKEIPVVFTGINGECARIISEKYNNNFTGVLEKLDIKGTFEQAFIIKPHLKKIYFLHDETLGGNEYFQEAKDALKSLNKNVNLVGVSDLEANDIGDTLANISKDSIVVLARYNQTLSGKKISSLQIMKTLSDKITEPIFALYDINMVYKAFGGSILSGEKQGVATGKLVKEVVDGGSVKNIPIVQGTEASNVYNYDAMKDLGLTEEDLPGNSSIINVDPKQYKGYQKLILEQTIGLGALAIIVIIMIINIKKRRLAEEEIRKAEEKYRYLFEASNDGLWEVDLETGAVLLSTEWGKKFDMWPEDDERKTIGNWLERVHPEDIDRANDILRRASSGEEKAYSVDYRVMNAKNKYVWINAKCRGIKDKSGKVVMLIGSHTYINAKKVYEGWINKLAFSDQLTGIDNRSEFARKFKEITRQGNKCTLVIVDLDNFKNINDFFGHSIGDEFLIEITHRLKNSIRETDVLARFGGDEFLILINGIVDTNSVRLYLENILSEIEETIVVGDFKISTSASLGVARYPYVSKNFEELFKKADAALYKAKESGKRAYVFFEEWMNKDVERIVKVEEALKIAIENNEFTLNFQPKYNIAEEKIDGFEALIRLNSSKLGPISPLEFIGIAEKTGMMIPVGKWVIENTCKFIKKLNEKGHRDVLVAINISVIQLMQNDFVNVVKNAILKSRVDPSTIEIEITESILMESIDSNMEKIKQLKELGLKIVLDDFGTGYSSLTYLKDIPADILKIDKSFIDELRTGSSQEKRGKKIIGTIIQLAHQMNFKVVAEGVESKEQYEYLKKYDCDHIQGYYIAKPLTPEDAIEILSKKIYV